MNNVLSKESRRRFREWASLFSGKLFVQIVVYADETGTQGIQKGKEPAPGVYGFMDSVESWDRFRPRWENALKRHGAPYFHFRELSRAERFGNNESRFYGWSDEKTDDFIYDMAITASLTAIPFGGGHALKRMAPGATTSEMYTIMFEQYFSDFSDTMNVLFPKFNGKASFFFDDNNNENWIAVLNKIHKAWREKDSRVGEYTSVKKGDERAVPCQAADLFAYVQRQQLEIVFDKDEIQPSRVLDLIISRNAFPKNHPKYKFALMPETKWRDLIRQLRDYKRKMDATNKIMGTPKQPYSLYNHPALRALFTTNEMRTMIRLAEKEKLQNGGQPTPPV